MKTFQTVYGEFSSGFQQGRLGDLCVPDAGIQTGPFGSQLHQQDYVEVGTPIITVEHLLDNRIGRMNLPCVTERDRARLSKYTIREGDIVFSRVGSVDRRSLVRQEEDGWLFSGRCLRVRPDSTKLDPQYLSYFFGMPSFREHIRAIAVGATMPSLNTALLSDIMVVYPPLAEQQRISAILGALDDKIELNRRTNETLEHMTRALFKSWFVDFDPVRGKMNGRWRRGEPLPGLSADLYDLFPDRLVPSELGEIPEGWTVSCFGDLAEIAGGSTPSTKEPAYWAGGTHRFATPKDLSSLSIPILLETERRITDEGLGRISSGLLPAGTVLMSSRAPIGYLAIAQNPVAVNQGFIAMAAKPGVSNLFLLYCTKFSQDEIVSRANGSTFLEISKTNFRPIPVLMPDDEVMARYDAAAKLLVDRIIVNCQVICELASQRDALLPRLLSGALRLPVAVDAGVEQS